MKKLNHENVIKLYNVYETQNSIYLILEFLNGGEMITKCKEQKSKFSMTDIKNIMEQIIKATLYMHQNDIMHRDLKPENILFKNKETQVLKIADFGLAQIISNDKVLFTRCGTPGFVAPEVLGYQSGSKLYDEKCDIFSLGVIFYLLMTGKQPFYAKDYKQILRNNKNCIVNYQELEGKHVTPDAINLLKKLLEKDPLKRITAQEALNDDFFSGFNSPRNKNLLQIPLQNSYTQLGHYNLHSFNQNLKNQNNSTDVGSLEYLINGEQKLQHNYQGIQERFESHQIINPTQGSILIQNYNYDQSQPSHQISPTKKQIQITVSNFNPQHQQQELQFNFENENNNHNIIKEGCNNANSYIISKDSQTNGSHNYNIITSEHQNNLILELHQEENDDKVFMNKSTGNEYNQNIVQQYRTSNTMKRKTSTDFRKKAIMNSQRISNQAFLEMDREQWSSSQKSSEYQNLKLLEQYEKNVSPDYMSSSSSDEQKDQISQNDFNEALDSTQTQVILSKNLLQLNVQNIFSNEIKKI